MDPQCQRCKQLKPDATVRPSDDVERDLCWNQVGGTLVLSKGELPLHTDNESSQHQTFGSEHGEESGERSDKIVENQQDGGESHALSSSTDHHLSVCSTHSNQPARSEIILFENIFSKIMCKTKSGREQCQFTGSLSESRDFVELVLNISGK